MSTRVFAVEHREYARPGREPLARDVVVHPGAVAILPVMEDGRIVMIRNYRHAVERELWELPAGTCEPDESPIETARRELAEETGYRADEITPLTEFFTSPGFTTEWMYAFLATGLTLVGQNLQGGEEIEVVIISADDARRRFLEGGFRDGKTVALLGLYFARLNE